MDVRTGLSERELVRLIPSYAGLIVRSATRVTARVIEAGGRLQVIGRAGVGLDNVDLDAATARGIAVLNAPSGNLHSAAEHTLGMLLALARNIPQADRALRHGDWDRKRFTGTEVRGKTLGLIGFGNVGRRVGRMAQGLGLKVLVYDPYLPAERVSREGAEPASFPRLLRSSDFISLHTPLTDQTRGLIDARAISRMKRGVRILNVGRGGLIDEGALCRALKRGKVAGAALDVFEREPIPADHPLLSLGNVIVTPHLGASTAEAQAEVSLEIAREILKGLRNGHFNGAVNVPFRLPEDGSDDVQRRLELSERLGRVQIQLLEGQPRLLRVTCDAAHGSLLDALTAFALKGVFEGLVDRTVNHINSGLIARERGLAVEKGVLPEGGGDGVLLYRGVALLDLVTERRSLRVAGAVFPDGTERLVELDGRHVEARLEGRMLIMFSKDVPGVIGRVGTMLAEAGVNIGEWRLGRREPGGVAVSAINVDDAVPKSTLLRIGGLKEIQSVKEIRLPEAVPPDSRVAKGRTVSL